MKEKKFKYSIPKLRIMGDRRNANCLDGSAASGNHRVDFTIPRDLCWVGSNVSGDQAGDPGCVSGSGDEAGYIGAPNALSCINGPVFGKTVVDACTSGGGVIV